VNFSLIFDRNFFIIKLQRGTMSELIRQGGIEELRNVLKQHFDKVKKIFSYISKSMKKDISI
jgi:hypothetical protein